MILTEPSHPFNLKLIQEFWKIKVVLENSLVSMVRLFGNCWNEYFHLLASFKCKKS